MRIALSLTARKSLPVCDRIPSRSALPFPTNVWRRLFTVAPTLVKPPDVALCSGLPL